MENRALVLFMMLLLLAATAGVAASYEYNCEGEVDGKRIGVRSIAMDGSDGTFTGGLGNMMLEARKEGDVLVMSITPVQNPGNRRTKRTHVPSGEDNPAKFSTRFKTGVFSIVCK